LLPSILPHTGTTSATRNQVDKPHFRPTTTHHGCRGTYTNMACLSPLTPGICMQMCIDHRATQASGKRGVSGWLTHQFIWFHLCWYCRPQAHCWPIWS